MGAKASRAVGADSKMAASSACESSSATLSCERIGACTGAKEGTIVTERSTVDDVAVLFDRGYGWVYLTSETGFETKSTTSCCLDRYKAESYRSTGEFLELRSRWYRCRLE